MRFLLTAAAILLSVFVAGCGQREVHLDELVERDIGRLNPAVSSSNPEGATWPVFFLGDSKKPYTGKAYEWHPDGQLKYERTFDDGWLNGPSINWDANGQKREEGHFKNGVRDGQWIMWDGEGNKIMEVLYDENHVVSRTRY